jgi:hypothetical protein
MPGCFATANRAGNSWKFIAETGAIYWKKLEIFFGPKLPDFAENGHSMQIRPFLHFSEKSGGRARKTPKNSDFLRCFGQNESCGAEINSCSKG